MEKVLITGASSGIGWAIAQFLADKGYQVYGTTRSLSKRAGLIAQAQAKYGERLQFLEMDVTNEKSVKEGVDSIIRRFGGLDILICNAGTGIYGSIEEMPMEMVIQQFDTNVYGYLRVLKAVIPHMRQQRSGRIIMISSMAGITAIPYQTHYSAGKYAIEAFTEGLRQELRGFGIKVAAVRPGDIRTNFNEVTLKHIPEDSPYKKWSEKCWEIIDKNIRVAPQPVLVAKVVHRVLKKRCPKTYYSAADFLAMLLPILLPFMSSGIKEKVIRLFYGVDFLK
ncbi:SDR family oxidoreductase [bacterium]|nr:SDR family oxidoreductase [bacterium]